MSQNDLVLSHSAMFFHLPITFLPLPLPPRRDFLDGESDIELVYSREGDKEEVQRVTVKESEGGGGGAGKKDRGRKKDKDKDGSGGRDGKDKKGKGETDGKDKKGNGKADGKDNKG